MKIGVIGLALSHPYTFAKGFAKRDAHVTAAWDDDAQKAREFVAEFGGEAVGTPEEVAQSDVDAVIVTSRAVDHAAHARLALEAGTPVFVTKPLSLDADDAATLVALSERRGTVLMSCSWIRYEPAYRALTTRLRDEALGEVVYARAVACHKIRSYIDTNDWQDDPALGGGTLINMGIHAVEPLVALMAAVGRTPEWVRCTAARTIYQDTRSEDIASFQVGFSGDLVTAVETICSASANGYWSEVFGTKESYVAEVPASLRERRAGPVAVDASPSGRDHMLDLFFESVKTGKSPVPLAETLAITEVLTAGRRSATNGGERISLTLSRNA